MRLPWNRERRQSSLAEPNQDLIAALGGELVTAGERVSVEGSIAITDVFVAVTLICELIQTLPLNVYRKVGVDTVETPEHRAAGMLGQAPNPVQPAHRFWSTVAGHLLLWGNAFIEKLRDENGLVTELWVWHPSCVEVQWNPTLRQKRFVVTDPNTNLRQTFADDRVLHIYGFTVDGMVGLSPIQQSRQQLGLAKARERFEGDVYARKPFLAGTINHPGRVQDGGKRIRESWRAIFAGGDRGVRAESGRHGVALLEEGATFSPFSAPLADMEFVASTQMSKTTIANIFHLPPSELGGSLGDSLTYQTVEGNWTQLARKAVAPVTTNIQKFLGADRGIFPFASWYPEFQLNALLRADSQTRAAFYTSLSSVGAITPNEIRGYENMPPLPGGDQVAAAAAPPSLPTGDVPTPAAAAPSSQGAQG